MNAYPFPSEFIKPEKKELPEYGLAHVRAQYNSTNRFGSVMFTDHGVEDALVELAQGRQSTTRISRALGRHRDKQTDIMGGPESLAYIDLQVLNLAPKYVNRAVAKMQRINFDIALEAIDPVSMDLKSDYGAAIKSFYELKDWAESQGIPAQAAFEGLDVASLPKYPDELLYDLQANPKIKREIAGELAIKLIHSINRFKQKMRQVDWDLVVKGWGHLHVYQDINGIPRTDVINHKYWGGSYVDNDDFEDQEYSFYLDCITVNQFIREASPYYTPRELQEIVIQHSIKNSQYSPGMQGYTEVDKWDNLNYIPVVRFYFRSEDNRVFVKRNNQYGSKILMEKDFNYTPPEDVMYRFMNGGDSKVIQNSYTSTYGGTWLIDSNIVYNYGRKNIPRTNLVNQSLPIKTFATNYKEGRAVSFTAQMEEPLFMINVAWNRIKETLADGWDGMREINFTELEKVAMGHGGNEWSPRQVYDFLGMKRTLIKRGNTNKFDQSNGSAITHVQTGVTMDHYFTMFTTGINILEQMTGTTLAESSEKPDRLAVGVMRESQNAGDLDMEYLYNAHEYLFERTAHMQLLMTQEALRNGVTIKHFIPALGKVNTGMYQVPKEIAYCEYGMAITRQPGPQEWIEFYGDMKEALIAGMISLSDCMFLREIDNIKQARQMLVVRESVHRREQMQLKQQDNEMAMQANQQAAQLKFQFDSQIAERDHQMAMELKELDGKIKLMLQQDNHMADSLGKKIGDQMKGIIEKQKGKDTILKEGLRSQSERYKSDSKHAEGVYKANVQSETALETAKINAKKKAAVKK